MIEDDIFCCPSCGVPYAKHLGVNGTCAALVDTRKRMAAAHAALLTIWPRGKDCEHTAAREAFKALEPVA